jgi:hypothetical protein
MANLPARTVAVRWKVPRAEAVKFANSPQLHSNGGYDGNWVLFCGRKSLTTSTIVEERPFRAAYWQSARIGL